MDSGSLAVPGLPGGGGCVLRPLQEGEGPSGSEPGQLPSGNHFHLF